MIKEWWDSTRIRVNHHLDDIVKWANNSDRWDPSTIPQELLSAFHDVRGIALSGDTDLIAANISNLEAIEWQRARQTMKQREQEYGGSLRTRPYSTHPWDRAVAEWENSNFEGNFDNHHPFKPGEWALVQLGFYNFRQSRENGFYILGKLNRVIKEHDDFAKVSMSALEEIDEVKISSRIELERGNAGEYWSRVQSETLEEKGMTPVKIQVLDRKLLIEGDGIYAEISVKECGTCQRPLWQFSDYQLVGIGRLPHPGIGAGFGGTNGYVFDYHNRDETSFCTPECVDVWVQSLPGKIKTEEQAKNFVMKQIDGITYDLGVLDFGVYSPKDGNLHMGVYREKGKYAWQVDLMRVTDNKDKPWQLQRYVRFDLEGNIIEDKVFRKSK